MVGGFKRGFTVVEWLVLLLIWVVVGSIPKPGQPQNIKYQLHHGTSCMAWHLIVCHAAICVRSHESVPANQDVGTLRVIKA